MRTFFILVPSAHPSGPVKGAFALANGLAPLRRVTMVYLKDGPGVDAPLDSRVEEISLAAARGGWRGRLSTYQRILSDAGGRDKVGSISMCLSADFINRFCANAAVICARSRGNLPQNYLHDYGIPGAPLAVGHLLALRSFDHVVAMTQSMAKQIRSLAGIRSKVIRNFVDEQALDFYRRTTPREDGRFRFVFVGSLSSRKQPALLVNAIEDLLRGGQNVQLDIIGDGPLRQEIESSISSRGLQQHIWLHGHLVSPYRLISAADVFVLPSRSEGVSRAALEALYLGVPCVVRNVDGNADLMSVPRSGKMFLRDAELSQAMLAAARSGCAISSAESLLPDEFRQEVAARQYLRLIESKV